MMSIKYKSFVYNERPNIKGKDTIFSRLGNNLFHQLVTCLCLVMLTLLQ